MALQSYDFECLHLGSIAAITALSEDADQWLHDHVDPESYMLSGDVWSGGLTTLYGEPRYMLDITLGMISDGLTCENSDKVDL